MAMKRFEKLTKYILEHSKNNDIDKIIIDEWKFLYEQVKPELTNYDKSKVDLVQLSKQDEGIVITMTSCKRYDLFTQTVNSILNNWTDLDRVDHWIVFDDNSSNEDRALMKENYPFIEYYMKSYEERGHLPSMNLIYEHLQIYKAKYWIHIEDDMLFFAKLPYITIGLQGLQDLKYFNVKQIVFNRNYMESIDQINLSGHLVYENGDYSMQDYKIGGSGCRYWPHFSFRPAITEVEAILSIGNFTGISTFFEYEYAQKYMDKGYRTGFFNTLTHIHIGRLCNTSGDNAYSLNNMPQFNGQRILDFNIKVINLKRREDRLKIITEKLQQESLPFEVIEAVDGTTLTLTKELQSMFKDNDFNYRRGVIGCALSHYNLWKRLVLSNCKYYLILEDDVVFCKNFKIKLSSIEKHLYSKSIMFLGYHMFDINRVNNLKYIENTDTIVVDYLKKNLFIGGTHCYSITKSAAQNLIDYIDIYGIKHGIDYLMGKAQNEVPVYETLPHLAYAEYSSTGIIDTDIQYDNVPVSRPISETINKNTIMDISNIELKQEDDYVFIRGVDQQNYDIPDSRSILNISDMKQLANQLENCVAFNTLGYFKSEIVELSFSDYYSPKDGIYIKKDYFDNVLKKTNKNDWIQYVINRSN